jgi:hypothetical protein
MRGAGHADLGPVHGELAGQFGKAEVIAGHHTDSSPRGVDAPGLVSGDQKVGLRRSVAEEVHLSIGQYEFPCRIDQERGVVEPCRAPLDEAPAKHPDPVFAGSLPDAGDHLPVQALCCGRVIPEVKESDRPELGEYDQ